VCVGGGLGGGHWADLEARPLRVGGGGGGGGCGGGVGGIKNTIGHITDADIETDETHLVWCGCVGICNMK